MIPRYQIICDIDFSEMHEWLDNYPEGEWSFMHELGDIKGVAFELKSDALLFKLKWL